MILRNYIFYNERIYIINFNFVYIHMYIYIYIYIYMIRGVKQKYVRKEIIIAIINTTHNIQNNNKRNFIQNGLET